MAMNVRNGKRVKNVNNKEKKIGKKECEEKTETKKI